MGNSGGCQAMYSVIPSTASTGPPSCRNVTFPSGPLGIVATVSNGILSQFGWIEEVLPFLRNSRHSWLNTAFITPQCTDIAVTPNNGTPPYVFTVGLALQSIEAQPHFFTEQIAPSLHPPYNITSSSRNTINWTVSLVSLNPVHFLTFFE